VSLEKEIQDKLREVIDSAPPIPVVPPLPEEITLMEVSQILASITGILDRQQLLIEALTDTTLALAREIDQQREGE
jgi:hypothetical protein